MGWAPRLLSLPGSQGAGAEDPAIWMLRVTPDPVGWRGRVRHRARGVRRSLPAAHVGLLPPPQPRAPGHPAQEIWPSASWGAARPLWPSAHRPQMAVTQEQCRKQTLPPAGQPREQRPAQL